MANANLKTAIENAGLTVEEFAEIIQVDPKSVQRWVTGTTTPYRRNRAAIARALDLTEDQLWPDDASTRPGEPTSSDGNADGTSEVVGSWGEETDPDAPDPIALVSHARERLDLYDGTYRVRRIPGLVDELLRRAEDGCEIRLLSDAPTRALERLLGHDHIELRLCGMGRYVLIRSGEAMLVTFALSVEGDRPQPLMQLRRQHDGGMFDRLAANFEAGWEDSDEIITDLAGLEVHLSNAEDELEDETPWDDLQPDAPQRAAAPDPPSQRAPVAQSSPRRRWPGRHE